MALMLNSIRILFWAKNLGVGYNRTATLGRQGLGCTARTIRQTLREFGLQASDEQLERCFQKGPCEGLFADNFYQILGAKEAVAIDYSDYEGAGLVHDLNTRFPDNLHGNFDVVLDAGTLEHIFDFPSALRNCLELVSVGGHFIATAVPANSLMGHGFYQFGPELFFRVLNAENGFVLRKIVLYEENQKNAPFFEVRDPATAGKRSQLSSAEPVVIALIAQKTAAVPILAHAPQQSDYAAIWSLPKSQLDRSTWFKRLRITLNPYWPLWLRHLKGAVICWLQRGPRGFNNTEVFRKLGPEEVARERASSQLPAGAKLFNG